MADYAMLGTPGDVDPEEWVRRRIGSEDAAREVLTFVRRWNELQSTHPDRDPSLAEFVEHWRVPRPDAARGLGLFRVAFPGEASPSTLKKTVEQTPAGAATLFDSSVQG